MAHTKRTPPIKVIVSVGLYNTLIEILSKNEIYDELEICDSAKRLKEKLLRYSIPFKDNGKEKVEVQFFVNEADDIIYHLLLNLKEVETSLDYYSVLLKIREAGSK